ncbi:MAG: hypothetical protein LBD10_06090 [Desulfobulbus sp.]|uniref:hypothetical protein n=1 Tax=Desulfobulbus sp. TaxID=895 RepID=UPI0028481204|nr:hypothetical protein [Desulfobulbus sp.]MDR2549748.1 hypothetical protein [Desulfobulbus sp.]
MTLYEFAQYSSAFFSSLSGTGEKYAELMDVEGKVAGIVTEGRKLELLVESFGYQLQQASDKVRFFAENLSDPASVALMRQAADDLAAKAITMSSNTTSAQARLAALAAEAESAVQAVSRWGNALGPVGRAASPVIDAAMMAAGAMEYMTTGNSDKFGQACMGVAMAAGLGILFGAGFAALSAPALGVALAAGFAAGLGSYFGNGLYDLLKDSIPWWLDFFGLNPGIDPATNNNFMAARNWLQRRDPLALDLDGDGIETVGILGASTVLFDHDGDGIKTGTGWLKGDDGWLVLDRNHNGSIDNGSELFGVDTVLANGQKATDGFAALRELDSNLDGKFDGQDALYGAVRVWQDANQDGISQAGELKTLAELGVTGIDLATKSATRNLGNGNIQTLTADAVGIGDAANLDLIENPFFSQFTNHIALTEQAKALPSVSGSGMVRELREAASLSPELAGTATILSATADRATFMSRLDEMLEQWADTAEFRSGIEQGVQVGVTDDSGDRRLFAIAYLLPGQRQSYLDESKNPRTSTMTPEGLAQFYAAQAAEAELTRRIGILEMFNGQRFMDFGDTTIRSGGGQVLISGSIIAGYDGPMTAGIIRKTAVISLPVNLS